MSRSMVDALSELYSPFLKGSKSTLLAAIVSGLFQKRNIDHSIYYGPNGPDRKKKELITKT